jgi:NAD(P)-dependent dehydrogenase (short-subunit alcohol dehydrogenase family)
MSEPPLGLRRVLVTGGGSGIGKAITEAIVQRGGQVVIVGRRADVLKRLEARAPDAIRCITCDVTDDASRESLLTRACNELGGLDGFVHAAGVSMHEPFGKILDESVNEQLELNLVAPLRLGEEALHVLDDGGAMLFLGSTLAHRPVETSAVYSATKAGLLSLMRSFAQAGAARGVRANAISPGVVDTGMVRALRLPTEMRPPRPEEVRKRVEEQLHGLRALHPLGRLGTPEEVADIAIHALGASWMTGSDLVIDGGLML